MKTVGFVGITRDFIRILSREIDRNHGFCWIVREFNADFVKDFDRE